MAENMQDVNSEQLLIVLHDGKARPVFQAPIPNLQRWADCTPAAPRQGLGAPPHCLFSQLFEGEPG